MKFIAVALALTILATEAWSTLPSVEIIVPPEHISTERNRISIVGRANTATVQMHVNGVLWGELAVTDFTFHTSVRLPYGLNKITVHPVTEDSLAIDFIGETIELLCGPDFSPAQGRLFESYRFHNRTPQHECLGCHTPDDEAQNADWCNPCHNTVRQRLQEHTVEQTRPCTGCHRIERDLTRTSTARPGSENPCYDCHTDKIGLFAQDFVHGPVAGGSCTVCHDPHGSQFVKTLVSPVPVLCEACHTDISGTKSAVQHYPFEQGWCIECHDPHATSNRWVLQKKGDALCGSCHFTDGTQRAHRHPTGVKPKKRLAVPLPLGPDGKLECLTCHEPHASNAPYLVRSRGEHTCLGCHPGMLE